MVHLGGPADQVEFGKRTLLAGTQTLLRGLSILELVGSGVSSAKQLSEALSVPRSTVARMIHNLVIEGYLYHIPDKGYFLGARLVELGDRAREQRPLAGLAKPFLQELSDEVHDTIHLGAPTEDGLILYLEKIDGGRGFRMRSRIGLTVPIAATGLGKAILMTMDPDLWKHFYDHALTLTKLQGFSPDLKSFDEFHSDLMLARSRGFAFDDEENETGIRCVAAPVFDHSETAIAAISISSTLNFMPRERLNRLGPEIVKCANRISWDLGWRDEK